MKNITKKEFENILNESGVYWDGNYGALLNYLSLILGRSAKLYEVENMTKIVQDDLTTRMANREKERSNKIYELLAQTGYYDDVWNDK